MILSLGSVMTSRHQHSGAGLGEPLAAPLLDRATGRTEGKRMKSSRARARQVERKMGHERRESSIL